MSASEGDKVIFPEQGEEKLTKVEPQVNASERKLSRKTDPEEFKRFKQDWRCVGYIQVDLFSSNAGTT